MFLGMVWLWIQRSIHSFG